MTFMTNPNRGTTVAGTNPGSFAPGNTNVAEAEAAGNLRVSKKSLGMMGLGPHSPNSYDEPFDAEQDRPLRPYFALTPGDDDEFFDAHPGSRIHVKVPGEDGKLVEKRFVRADKLDENGTPVWFEMSQRREVIAGEVNASDLWAEMFDDEGAMHSARFHMPVGMLYSDSRRFVNREDVDVPMTITQLRDRLKSVRVEMVSASLFGDTRQDGIREGFTGVLDIDLADDGTLTFGPDLHGPIQRVFNASRVQVFDREGDIVIRQTEAGPGSYGWEEVLRVV